MTEESLQKANVTKLAANISILRISDLVVRLGCSLSYKSMWCLCVCYSEMHIL